jgi:plasmid stabilization system protein ParE
MNLRFASRAARRLEQIVDRHRANAVWVANFERQVKRCLRSVCEFHELGRPIPEYPGWPVREFFVEPYRFFYHYDAARNVVWIVDIWHRRQRPTSPWVPARPD